MSLSSLYYLPSTSLGIEVQHRTNFTVFVSANVFRGYAESEAFARVKFEEFEQKECKWTEIVARVLPLDNYEQICTLMNVDNNSIFMELEMAMKEGIKATSATLTLIKRYRSPTIRLLTLKPLESNLQEIYYPNHTYVKQIFLKRPVCPGFIATLRCSNGCFSDFQVSYQLYCSEYEKDGETNWGIICEDGYAFVIPPFVSLPSKPKVLNEIFNNSNVTTRVIKKSHFILHGVAGSGKTSIALEAAKDMFCIHVTLPVLLNSSASLIERINYMFEIAIILQPCTLIFDDMHLIAPCESNATEYTFPIVSTLARNFSRILCSIDIYFILDPELYSNVCIMAISIDVASINPLISKYFSDEYHIESPSTEELALIYRYHAKQLNVTADFNELAALSNGFVGSDVVVVTRDAFMVSTQLHSTCVTVDHYKEVLKCYKPSELGRELSISNHSFVKWGDVKGLSKVKQKLERLVLVPIKSSNILKKYKIDISPGILLSGPSGLGKTFIVSSLADAASAHLIPLSLADVIQSHIGESEKIISDVFRRAKLVSPCIIMLDEMQSIFSSSENDNTRKIQSQIFSEMNQLGKLDSRIFVIAITNRIDLLSYEVTSANKFGQIVYFDTPTLVDRLEVLTQFKLKFNWSDDVDLTWIANRTAGYTFADLVKLSQEVAYSSMRSSQLDSILPVNVYLSYLLEY